MSDWPRRAVARGEHAAHGGRVGLYGLHVPARVELHTELFEQLPLGSEEAHRQQHELRGELALGALHRRERRLGLGLCDVQGRDRAVAVVAEAGGRHRVVLLAHAGLPGLLHRVAQAVLQRPLRPRRAIVGPVRRRLGEELELRNGARALAQRVAHAVRPRVAAADHHHVGVLRRDLPLGHWLGDGGLGAELASDPPVAPVQVVHREMHAVELPAGHRQIARHARAGGQHDRVEPLAQLLHAHVASHLHAAAQLHALRAQLLDAPLHHGLLDLEVRHAEAHEPSDRLVALEQRHAVARPAQLLRSGHARRAGPDDGDALTGLAARRAGRDPALLPRAVDDRVLDLLDRDRVALADLEHARRLARRGAQAAGELGEVVGRVQLCDRVLEAVAVDEVVPVGNQVPQGAAVVAERHPAVHAASALLAQLLDGPREQELAVVVHAFERVALGNAPALDLKEAAELAHQAGSSSAAGVPTASSGRETAAPPFSSARAAAAEASAGETPATEASAAEAPAAVAFAASSSRTRL